MDTTLEEVAYHEAGHAVAAHVLGTPVQYATILADEARGNLGHVRLEAIAELAGEEAELDTGYEGKVDADIVISLAGGLAAKRHIGTYNADGCNSDNRGIANAAVGLVGSAGAASFEVEVLARAANRLLDRTWPAVIAVADALLREKTLSGSQLTRHIHSALLAPHPTEAIALDVRVALLEARLTELQAHINGGKRLLRVPVGLQDAAGRLVGQLTERGVESLGRWPAGSRETEQNDESPS